MVPMAKILPHLVKLGVGLHVLGARSVEGSVSSRAAVDGDEVWKGVGKLPCACSTYCGLRKLTVWGCSHGVQQYVRVSVDRGHANQHCHLQHGMDLVCVQPISVPSVMYCWLMAASNSATTTRVSWKRTPNF